MGCRWNRLDEPVFMAVSFWGLTGILYFEKFYALCWTFFLVIVQLINFSYGTCVLTFDFFFQIMSFTSFVTLQWRTEWTYSECSMPSTTSQISGMIYYVDLTFTSSKRSGNRCVFVFSGRPAFSDLKRRASLHPLLIQLYLDLAHFVRRYERVL